MEKIYWMPFVAAAFFLTLGLGTPAQVPDSNHTVYRDQCPSLQSVSPADALQYLNDNPPTQANSNCVTWSIYVVGDAKYQPAIPALLGLLNFRRDMTVLRTWNHLPGSLYPAVDALEDIGKPALSPILDSIKSAKTSHADRAHATDAVLEIFRRTGKESNGFALLRREATAATDDAVKGDLEEAIQYGLRNWCTNPKSNCQQSAEDGVDR